MRRFRTRRRKPDGNEERPARGRKAPRRGRPDRDEGEPRPQGSRRAPVWEGEPAAAWPVLLAALVRNRDRDLTVWQLLEELNAGEEGVDALRAQVAFLEKLGILHHHRRGRIRLHARHGLVAGRLTVPPSSRAIGRHWGAAGAFGFVRTASAGGDLYVPSRGMSGARHGDLVLAHEEVSRRRSDRTQGAVLAILARAPSRFAGQVVEVDGRLVVRPRDERSRADVPVDSSGDGRPRIETEEGRRRRVGEGKAAARAGDLVVADVEEGGPAGGRARIVEVLGAASEIDAAERLVIADLGLPGEFPEEVEEEAAAVPAAVTPEQLAGRTDFREATVITIDPSDARDFDDAIAAEALPGGILRLWIHIADVAAYVPEGGALDREAFARGTSVYFPGRVIPMLPHALSSGICSLKEGEDRLVQSVGIDYTREAKVTGVRFADGVIRSAARLTYEEAAAMLEGRSGPERPAAAPLLKLLAPLAKRLTARRMSRGALDLDLPEVEVDRGKDGAAVGLRSHDRNDAHRLIEEFMLAANEAVARRLAETKLPAVYRVHEEPDAREVEKVERELAELGVKRAGGAGLAERLQKILRQFEGRPEEAIIGKFVLKALKLARYAAARAGHFGLALTHYTHFTSPIRRYPDLAVHRMLRAARGAGGGRRASRQEVETIAAESSRLERRAVEAERAITDLLVAHHLKSRLGQLFEGRVSGITRGGVFVALLGEGLPEGAAEGFAPVARASDYVLTEPLRVRLEEADLLRGRLRLSIASG